ncbi:MAG TPA: hypothetical protein VLD37_02655 [Candidatus Bilamarchaeum sp.]|nr:hypothetical protein [Candidatus Bilamarchaeum sp.]
MLGFGCISEKNFTESRDERILSNESVDLDLDGAPDYYVYTFAPVDITGANMRIQRQMAVSVKTEGEYTSVTENLTDVDLLLAQESIDDFSTSKEQADYKCSQAIGLSNVVCSDVNTCARLCSAASQKCRGIAALSDEALAGQMISYVQDNTQIGSLYLDARDMVMELRNTTSDKRNEYLNRVKDMIEEVADVNSNLLYTGTDLALCEHSDFGVPSLVDAMKKLGNYESHPTDYHYRMLISAKPIKPGGDVAGVSLKDRVSRTFVTKSGGEVSSIQSISVSEDAANLVVDWSSPKSVKEGYLLYYEFKSDQGPDAFISELNTPEVKVKELNLSFLAPTNSLIIALSGMLGNYFIAYGAAFAITLSALLVLYNLVILILAIVSERAAGASLTTGFRKAFGRTDVRWKTDIVVAVLFLGAGYFVSSTMATQPSAIPTLMESVDFLLKSQMGIVGIGLVFIGVLMSYFAIENLTKIVILERAYGMVIKHEKDMFLARAASLKDRIAELDRLIEEYMKEDFDVSKEYDILTAVKSEKLDTVSKEMTARTKTIVEENLSKVESAISSLNEKKKLADTNWPKWKDAISKMLEEQGEVYTSSLVTVPASLRAWALGRYVKLEGADGIIFERDSIKKRKITPEQLVQEMVEKGIIKGAIVLKQDKVVISEFAEGSGTVMSALAVKLNAYLTSLSKNLGQKPPQSFVAVGDKSVFVILRGRGVDSILFVSKDKFNSAIESWKAKVKVFEAS